MTATQEQTVKENSVSTADSLSRTNTALALVTPEQVYVVEKNVVEENRDGSDR